MFRRRRNFVRARRTRQNQSVRTYSSKVGSGFVQSRFSRGPRFERCKFLDLNWENDTSQGYYTNVPLTCTSASMPINPSTQLTPNKRSLNLVINGSANNDRVSARILMKSVLISGSIYYAPLVNAGGTARLPASSGVKVPGGTSRDISVSEIDRSVDIFVVYYPRIIFSDYPAWITLLESPVSTRSMQDETNVYGARILLRKTFRLSVETSGVSGGSGAPTYSVSHRSRRDFRWKLNLNLPTEWTNSGPAGSPSLGSIRSGHLMIYCLSNVYTEALSTNIEASLAPYVTMRSRLSFVDA